MHGTNVKKILVSNLHFIHVRNILIANIVFQLHMLASLTEFALILFLFK